MKKLNNHGWGMRDMIIIMCILIIVLLVAIHYINEFYTGLELGEANAQRHTQHLEEIRENNSKKEVETNNNNNNNNDDSQNNSVKQVTTNYTILEKKLSKSALNYVLDMDVEIEDNFTLTLTYNELNVNNYIDNLIEESGKSVCDGYAIVYAQDGELISDPYITCSNYQTENFESWRLD